MQISHLVYYIPDDDTDEYVYDNDSDINESYTITTMRTTDNADKSIDLFDNSSIFNDNDTDYNNDNNTDIDKVTDSVGDFVFDEDDLIMCFVPNTEVPDLGCEFDTNTWQGDMKPCRKVGQRLEFNRFRHFAFG
jgi:hypothetical protein